MEKLIRSTIVEHLNNNNFLISNKQFGFVSGRSTTIQLIQVLDEWIQSFEEGNEVDVIYMDFQKAFDTVTTDQWAYHTKPHIRLVQKLQTFCIGEKEWWSKAFWKTGNNKYASMAKNPQAEEWPVECHKAVSSGQPVLFVMYLNDLLDMVKSPACLFANDTKIFRPIRSIEDQNILQDDLLKLQSRWDKWLLRFHPDKYKVMSLHE